ncbi:MAG: 2,3-bisphosphoglycerate-independent phosphoglycerate mutase [archaeon]
MVTKPVVVIIRDGWGYNPRKTENAIAEGKTPRTDAMMREFPNVLIEASGQAVGLPPGNQGNSEVGHMTMGSGRIIFQSLMRINKDIESGEFFTNPVLLRAISHCQDRGSALHIVGLNQTEGVHAHRDHLFALLDLCKKQGFSDVFLHVITDGRDAPVNKGVSMLRDLKQKTASVGIGRIASMSGRYFAMDRDKRWDRTKKAYDCIVKAEAPGFEEAEAQLLSCYEEGETDEFIVPRKATWYEGVKPGDGILFFNFRTDRPRQLTRAIVDDDFEGWERRPLDVHYTGMTQFYSSMNADVAYPDIPLENILGQVISEKGLRQLRISETEKYAHVTFFFNAQIEEPFEGEDRILIHSPKVPTYDSAPEMSAYKITDRIIEQIDAGVHDLIVTNIVNGDMIGHTGVRDACLRAVEVVDECVGNITDKVLEKGGVALIFADHGNIEDQSELWRTSHTSNDVPLIFLARADMLSAYTLREGGGLADIAPTVLRLLGIKQPSDMTGKSLLEKSP